MQGKGGPLLKRFTKIILIAMATFLCIPLAYLSFAEKLTLAEGIKIVTEDSRLIKIQQQEEAVSEADTLIAMSGLLPQVNASYTQNRLDLQPGMNVGSQSAYTAEKSFYTYGLSIRQMLYDFKGISSIYEASKKIYETKQIDTKRIKNTVALQFALTYFDLLETEKMVIVAEKERERLEAHLNLARNLYKEGVITKNDLLQAEVRLSDAKQKLLTTKNLKKIHTSRLNNMLTRPLSTQLETEEVLRETTDRVELDKAYEEAEKLRYEVKIADTMLDAVQFEELAKKSEYFPKFFLEGRYDYTKNKYQLQEGNWSFILGMNINFLSGGSTKASLSKIAHQKQRLVIERKKLLDDVRLEVERFYLDMVNAQEKIRVTKGATTQAEENLRINTVKYKDGVGTATDTIDAITLLTVAETNYYKSLYDFCRSEAGLAYATGKDLLEVYK
jgi:outer membrane protein TolC